MAQYEAVVDLAFPLRGTTIPADHGYTLYAAISRHLPSFHGDETIGIHPVRGQLIGQRKLALTRASQIVLRLPVQRIPEAIRLAGRQLDLDGSHALIGVPSTRLLRPSPSVTSRLVVIRGFTEAEAFLDAVNRQMADHGIAGAVSVPARKTGWSVEGQAGSREVVVRRTIRIHDREVVGFAVRVHALAPGDSVKLQATGLGGRRRFGCGIFVPLK